MLRFPTRAQMSGEGRGIDLLATRRGRLVLFTVLYASEGAPIGFIWWALPTVLRSQGVDISNITALTAALALPWAFKFIWAPVVDAVRSPRWGLRAWIISAQLVMGFALLPLLVLDYHADLSLIVVFLIAHAFAAATQDVAIDALSISTVPPSERGSINGWMQAGMLTGRALLGGVGLVLARTIGEQGLILVLVAVIWSSLAVLLLAKIPAALAPSASQRFGELVEHIRAALLRRETWIGLAFAAIGGAGFEAVGAVAGPYLIDRGLGADTVGFFFAAVSVPCMVAGAIAGGALADRWGKIGAVQLFLLAIFTAIAVLAFSDVSTSQPSVVQTLAPLALVYVAIGLFTASSYALFMDLTDARIAATQFSAFMAMTNLCESWSAFAVGRMIVPLGYPMAFLAMGALSLLALPLLRALRGSTPA